MGSEAVFSYIKFLHIFKVASSNIGSSLDVLLICNSSSHEDFDFYRLDFNLFSYFLIAL